MMTRYLPPLLLLWMRPKLTLSKVPLILVNSSLLPTSANSSHLRLQRRKRSQASETGSPRASKSRTSFLSAIFKNWRISQRLAPGKKMEDTGILTSLLKFCKFSSLTTIPAMSDSSTIQINFGTAKFWIWSTGSSEKANMWKFARQLLSITKTPLTARLSASRTTLTSCLSLTPVLLHRAWKLIKSLRPIITKGPSFSLVTVLESYTLSSLARWHTRTSCHWWASTRYWTKSQSPINSIVWELLSCIPSHKSMQIKQTLSSVSLEYSIKKPIHIAISMRNSRHWRKTSSFPSLSKPLSKITLFSFPTRLRKFWLRVMKHFSLMLSAMNLLKSLLALSSCTLLW